MADFECSVTVSGAVKIAAKTFYTFTYIHFKTGEVEAKWQDTTME